MARASALQAEIDELEAVCEYGTTPPMSEEQHTAFDSSSDSDSSIDSVDEIRRDLNTARRMRLSPDDKIRVTVERCVAELKDRLDAKLVAREIQGGMDMD